jgi:hypothetical protein
MYKNINKLWPLVVLSCFIFAAAYFFSINVELSRVNSFGSPRIAQAVELKTQVSENPYNKAAQQLQAKEKNLNTVANELQQSSQTHDLLLLILVVMIITLFLLVSLNYYLDFRRKQNDSLKK